MSEKTDSLHENFGQAGNAPTGPSYAHPQQDEIVRDSVALLETIPEGKRLVGSIKDLNISIRVIVGREPNFFVPDANTVVINCPKNLAGVDPYENACNLGIGIREIEINLVNIERLKKEPHLYHQKIVDIILEMCNIVSEFQDVHNHLKLVALIEKLGYGNVYKLYKSKASQKEMADEVVKVFKLEGSK